MFKPGDIVELVKGGKIGCEWADFTEENGIKVGEIFEVKEMLENNKSLSLKGYEWWMHPDHFKLAEIEVGDEVEIKNYSCVHKGTREDCKCIGRKGTIEEIGKKEINVRFGISSWCIYDKSHLKLIKKGAKKMSKVSKYDDLKQRIEQVEGWTREADDILQEIYQDGQCPKLVGASINITIYNNDRGFILLRGIDEWKTFGYTDQCSKLRAFKDALLWLLEHSNIKKDTFPEGDVEVEGMLTIGGVSKKVKIKGTITQRD